jgi:protease-4
MRFAVNKKKMIVIAAVILLAMALVAATSDYWHGREMANKGYVAVIRIDGPIYGGSGSNSILMNETNGTSSEDLMDQFEQARKDPTVKAILVRMNTPGGSTGATQEVAEEMDKVRSSGKPIVISMGDECASAGYWLASKGNYIFANPATITGSIGVYMDYNNIEGLMDKLGIRNEKIKSGAHKDIMSMSRPMTEEERQMLQAMVDDIYNQFVRTVADGRHLDESKVRAIADGRILTGKQAQADGLVDAMGNYYDALTYAASSSGLDTDSIQVKKYDSGMSLRSLINGEAEHFSKSFASYLADSFRQSMTKSSDPSIQ